MYGPRVGVWIPLWAEGRIEDGRSAYCRVGGTHLKTYFRREYGGVSHSDTSWAGYIGVGYADGEVLSDGTAAAIGLELRFTLGSNFNLGGTDMDADALEIVLVFNTAPSDMLRGPWPIFPLFH